jgi:hypothetical protein
MGQSDKGMKIAQRAKGDDEDFTRDFARRRGQEAIFLLTDAAGAGKTPSPTNPEPVARSALHAARADL